MKTFKAIKAALLAVGLLALPVAYAATMTKADYRAGKTRISADYKSNKEACASLTASAKDICVQEAKAKEKVARAELEYDYTGKPADRNKVRVAKAESAYALTKERCGDRLGNAKDVCVKEAKAVQTKALADAKMGKRIGDVKRDAAADKLDADYDVAVEKCDTLTGDAKRSCVAAARTRFGKT